MLYQIFILSVISMLCYTHPLTFNETTNEVVYDAKQAVRSTKYKYLHDDWVTLYDGYKYKRTTTTQDWSDSRSICGLWGGDLAVQAVHDITTRKLLFEALSIRNTRIWIGLHKNVGNKWFWVNGELALPAAALWLPGEPNDPAPNEEIETCAEIISTPELGGFGSNNVPCNLERIALCEKNIAVDDL